MPDAPGSARTSLVDTVAAMQRGNNFQITFSPGVPIAPAAQEPIRGWDFPVNFNSNMRPRAYAQSGFTFAQLRAFANVELVRLAIETRKDQVESLDWAIKPKDNKQEKDNRCEEMEQFFNKPDGVTPLLSLIRVILEDLLALDAPCLEMRRNRGGKLIGFQYVPGDTIVPKVDGTGRVPTDPDALAYQQVIKGVVWNDLTRKDILYVPRNIRAGHVYGFGPVEQIIVTINTIMRRQAGQLAHFTSGNVPAGLLNAPEGWQPDKIKELQDWMDDKISGNQAEQSKLLWGPFGSRYVAFKDPPIKDDFDEWLARVVAYAFSLPPTPFVRQMNKGTAGEDQSRALQEGLLPIKLWVKNRIIDPIIQDEFGYNDLEFTFIDSETLDPLVQNNVEDKNVRNGSATLDEIRGERGQSPLPDGMGAEPLVYTSNGIIRLRDALEQSANPPTEITPPMPAAEGGAAPASEPAPEDGQGAKVPPKAMAAKKIAKAHVKRPGAITVHRSTAVATRKALAKKIAPILEKVGKSVATQVTNALDASGVAKAEDDPTPAATARLIASRLILKLDLSELAELQAELESELSALAADSAVLAVKSIDGYLPDENIVDQVFDRAVAWAKDRAAELVSLHGEDSLVAATRDEIRGVVADGLANNIGTPAIAKSIEMSQAFSEERSSLIARTEVTFANENGKMEGWSQVQEEGTQLEKAWQTTNDDNCCDECSTNEDEGYIPLDDAFDSGDTEGPAHPNCQCVTVARSVSSDTGDETDSEEE